MLKKFLNILQCSFETYQDSLVLNSAEFNNPKLVLRATLHFEDEGNNYIEKYAEWKIIFDVVRYHKIILGDCWTYDFKDEDSDDILKWKYSKPYCSVSFYGKTENANEIIGALCMAHIKTVGEEIPFHTFLNKPSNLENLLSGGYGLLAENIPVSLAKIYKEVLENYGISANLSESRLPAYWNGEIRTTEIKPLKLMILGESEIVCENIEAKEIHLHEI